MMKLENLHYLNQGKTIIVVTNDEDFKEYPTKVIELR